MSHTTFTLGAALTPSAQRIDLGPEHPSRAGIVDIVVTEGDGIITAAQVRPGAIHRCVEKLFEVRDYRQILSLANRHDWQASFVGELGAALVIEAALGLETPPRATCLRTMLAELARLSSHLAFLSAVPDALVPDVAVSGRLRLLRRDLRVLVSAHSGNRVHPMVVRLGGLALDVPPGWTERAVAVAHAAEDVAAEVGSLMAAADLPVVAPLSRAAIADFGITGPAARGTGVDLDLRRLQPYLVYGDLGPELPVQVGGDAASRLRQWAAEVGPTVRLVERLAATLDDLSGEVVVKLPKIVRVPEGESYVATEGPLGHAGWFLVSRGDKVPWRLKLRTASFANLSALEAVLPGTPIDHLPLAVASFGYVVGDVAK